ncbi:hypothetical protein GCM10010174_04750 [Kutzneria viridogrisea]
MDQAQWPVAITVNRWTWAVTGMPRFDVCETQARQRFANLVDVLFDVDRVPLDVARTASRLTLLREWRVPEAPTRRTGSADTRYRNVRHATEPERAARRPGLARPRSGLVNA